jgi:acetate kinase
LDFADNHLSHDGLTAVGHRIVHGGADHTVPELIMPMLLTAMRAADPLHMPDNLAPKRAVAAARPALMQVACFNTAFHHTMPSVAKRFALPRAISAQGVHRYRFHGLSYEYIAGRLANQSPALAHLGSSSRILAPGPVCAR